MRLAVGAGRGRVDAAAARRGARPFGRRDGRRAICLAFGSVDTLVALQPANLPRIDEVRVDRSRWCLRLAWRCSPPSRSASRPRRAPLADDLRESLAEGTRTSAGGRSSERMRQSLVVAQVALTIVLLIGAGLLTRSFINVIAIDPGFSTEGALLLETHGPVRRETTCVSGASKCNSN